MAFNTTRMTLAEALPRARQQANSIKRIAENNRARMTPRSLSATHDGSITMGGLLSLLDNLRGTHALLSEVATLPGIAEYAQTQMGSATVAADFGAMLGRIDAAATWIVTNIPRSSDGALKERAFSAQGVLTELSLSAEETAGLRAALDALIATID